jgi:hypothetical protein
VGEILGEISSPESRFLKYLADLVFRRPSYAVIILVGLLKLGPKQNKPGFCTFGPMSHIWAYEPFLATTNPAVFEELFKQRQNKVAFKTIEDGYWIRTSLREDGYHKSTDFGADIDTHKIQTPPLSLP